MARSIDSAPTGCISKRISEIRQYMRGSEISRSDGALPGGSPGVRHPARMWGDGTRWEKNPHACRPTHERGTQRFLAASRSWGRGCFACFLTLRAYEFSGRKGTPYKLEKKEGFISQSGICACCGPMRCVRAGRLRRAPHPGRGPGRSSSILRGKCRWGGRRGSEDGTCDDMRGVEEQSEGRVTHQEWRRAGE